MNWVYALSIILLGVVINYYLILQLNLKKRLWKLGINTVGTVTSRVVTTGRYATVYIHYQFTTLEGRCVNGVSESNPRHTLKKGDQVPVIYEANDSSNHSLIREVGIDRNLFFIVLLWLGVLLILLKIWR